MGEDFLSESETKKAAPPPVFRLHRRLFLLVCAVAVLWQCLLFIDMHVQRYAAELRDAFKVVLTVDGKVSNEALAQMGESLNQKTDIVTVKLFSPEDGMAIVRRQNPQLAESLLLMGKNKMPAYFEVKLTPQVIHNIVPFTDNLSAEYEQLTPHYNAQHARLIVYTGLCAKMLRLGMVFAGVLFLAFMFFVEAYPEKKAQSHYGAGVLSGLLAAGVSCALAAVLLYPAGFLSEPLRAFTTPERQFIVFVFCGLLGWTLSKWQKF